MTAGERTLHGFAFADVGKMLPEAIRRFLCRLTSHPEPPSAHVGAMHNAEDCLPVYSITRVRHDYWIVRRRGSLAERSFADPSNAETFVRHDCAGSCATLELHIGTLYVAAQIDAGRPTLFRDVGS